MKYVVLIALCIICTAFGSAIQEIEEILAEPNEEYYDSQRKDCVALKEECTNNRDGCCQNGFSNVTCECSRWTEDTQKSVQRCWCERNGNLLQKTGDWLSDIYKYVVR